ncbi:NAD(P)-dependent oxidoreductase [Rhodococcus sp. WS3]|uniref:mycofactocin-coupled SDR family oxidoreductase n=1 Tax=unclassified Rhodococcus (in: high G+C Gram-positive bacteria) TaxID=192944 RepID=UPI0005D418D1|nr:MULTISPECIES: mycofactocin-coupled SDR family oxidoreductase [unclassified Rhodococcus (in: high G+C Gram-positive bacteria)]KJF19281.1 putative NAD-dependent oxidoreductase [Rhodococcus sp. AD45]ROZ42760.1 NAD(P)-dependent oxidoreductase [Rhodococcus sp. WS3]RZL21026.1 MAG: NAD(P)-dependent oxidoreductase [Rhodococcus sp. (in: high G+C Gram-positive bacteria)]
MTDLRGKVAFVTGAARGQGRSHALALAGAGADIVAVDICQDIDTAPYPLGTKEDLEETANQVRALGRRIITSATDTRSSEQLDSVVAQAVSEFGTIDITVANAGIWALGNLWELTDDQWNTVLDTNLSGVWRTVKSVVPTMIKGAGGAIVLTSSVNGYEAGGGMTHYVAAKHGVLGLMRNAALELGRYNIRCNAVCPGIVDTAMNDWQGSYDMMAGRPGGTPEDRRNGAYNWSALSDRGLLPSASISKAVLWLASDDSSDVTGVALPVDGGHSVLPGTNPDPVITGRVSS